TESGTEVARGKDLVSLKRELAKPLEATVLGVHSEFEQSGLTQWPAAPLPRTLDKGPAVVWPALVDEGSSVGVQVFATDLEQQVAMVRGLTRLLSMSLPDPSNHLVKKLPLIEALMLSTAGYQ